MGYPVERSKVWHVVCELKIDVGPGYRVYYTERNGVVVGLLAVGDKSSQQKDIKTAITLANGLSEHLHDRSNFQTNNVTEEMAAYLDAWLEEASEDATARALGDLARAKGMTQVASDAGLSREGLLKRWAKMATPPSQPF